MTAPAATARRLVRTYRLLALLAAVVMAGTLPACTKTPTPTTTQTSTTPTPTAANNPQAREALSDGGTLRIAMASLPISWNPYAANGPRTDPDSVAGPMVPRYFVFDASGVGSANPDYLSGASIANSNTVVTLTLNPRARWGDGLAITATDFIATWKALNGARRDFQARSTWGWSSISSVAAGADQYQVVLTFSAPFPEWQQLLATGPLRAESAVSAKVFNTGWASPNAAWFAGPYAASTVDVTQGLVTLKPSTTWWGDKPKLDSITYRVIEQQAWLTAYQNNELDIVPVAADRVSLGKAQAAASTTIRNGYSLTYRQLVLATGRTPTDDLAVRQAIVMGIDRKAVGATRYGDLGWAARSLDSAVFLTQQAGYVNTAMSTGVTYDQAAAAYLLESGGWVIPRDQKVRAKAGTLLQISIGYPATDTAARTEAESIASSLSAVGFGVDIIEVPAAEWAARAGAGEFTIYCSDATGSHLPLTALQHNYATGGSNNVSGFSSPTVDQLIAQAHSAATPIRQQDYAAQADRIIWTQTLRVPMYQLPGLVATKTRLANLGANGFGTSLWQNVGWMR